jgi:acyl-coenzyme A synthetase/AMP-(fatty) acid ligase
MLILGATRNLCWLCLRCMNVCCRCTADCGWITGHSYLTYGPLLNGATVVVFEGVRIWGLLLLRDGDASGTNPLLVLCHLIPSKPLQAWMWNSSIFLQLEWVSAKATILYSWYSVEMCIWVVQVPNYPDAGRCWEIVDKYKVTIFYTAPTAIRSLMRSGDEVIMLVIWCN